MTDSLDRAADRVPAICDRIDADVSAALRERARTMADRADTEYPINRAPSVAAASAIYLAGLVENEKLTQQQVADAADVNVASIRGCYRELFEHEGLGEGVELGKRGRDDSGETRGGGFRTPPMVHQIGAAAITLAVVAVGANHVLGRVGVETSERIAENAPTVIELWPAALAVVAVGAFIVLAMPYLPGMVGRGGLR